MGDCIFCDIITGKADASVVFRDDTCMVFMDIHPVTAGHLLVIPLVHSPDLAGLDEETGAHLFRVGQRLDAALRASGLRCDGVNLFLADGAAAGQEVFHVHLHVLPRFPGDGFGFRFGPDRWKPHAREELDAHAKQIRSAL